MEQRSDSESKHLRIVDGESADETPGTEQAPVAAPAPGPGVTFGATTVTGTYATVAMAGEIVINQRGDQ